VLAEAGDVPTTEHKLNVCRPRVLILDLSMRGESSVAAIPRMRQTSPDTQIVVLTMHNDPAFAREALREGAAASVLKEAADTELVQAVRLAAAGRTYLNPQLGARLATASAAAAGPPTDLSAREVEVLRLIALGHTNSEIASTLHLSVRPRVSERETHSAPETGPVSRIHTVVADRSVVRRNGASKEPLAVYARDRPLIDPPT
jgi:two-component system, NarL family, response regulator NreC